LRIACLLARALLETGGFTAFEEGLALNRGYLERYWSSVHPMLDPDDDNDPTLRVNTVSLLSDPASTVRSLRMAPMVSSRMLGQFSLRDLGVAMGEVPPALNEDAPKLSSIEAAFMECDLEQLRENAEAIGQSLAHAEAIESVVTDQVGAARAVSMEKLRDTLRELHNVLRTKLSQRDAGQIPEEASTETAGAVDGGRGPQPRLTGEIRTREDAVIALEKVCQYYLRHEPSSPLPMLLNRAKRLANKSFLEIMKDLSPDAVEQLRALGGSDEEGN
jgi:type VI secretion system protein ImpA